MTRWHSIRSTAVPALLAALMLAACGGDKPEAMLASAKDYLAKNESKAAVIQLKNALQKSPDLAEARFLLGKALLDGGDVAGAETELRKALQFKYPADQVVPVLAQALLRSGQFKKVADELGSTEVATPQGKAELQTAVGQADLALGKAEAAHLAFAAATAAQPDYAPALLGEARLKASQRDLPGGLAIVEAVLAKSPKIADGWQLKGDILAAQNQAEPALAAYRKALEAKSDYLPAHTAIVAILVQQDKLDEAGKQLEAMKQVAPKHPQTMYLLAQLAFRQKNFAAAREAIQQQLKLMPDHPAGLQLAGAIEYELKSYAQAETYLVKALQAAPELGLARRVLISSYIRAGQPTKAMDTLRPVLDKIDKDSNMLALAGQVYMQNGDAKRATEFFAKASSLDPGNAAKRTSLALGHLATGRADTAFTELEQISASDTGIGADMALIATRMQRGEVDKALVAIAALEKKQADSPVPHSLRGGALLAKRDAAGARKSFERAVAINPAFFPAAAALANLDLADKKPDDARKRFEAVLAKEPKSIPALLALAELRGKTGGSSEEVAALIGKAVTANPAESSPRLALIGYYLSTRDPKKAVAAAQEALAALPDHPEIVDAAGRAQQAAGDTNQALASYGKLASLQPNSPLPFLRMAEIHAAAKNKDAAFQSLRKALALKPDLVEAQRGLILLDLDAQRFPDAVAVARDVQKQRPKEAVGFALEGDIYASKRSWQDALAAYRTGLKQVGTTDLAVKLYAALYASGDGAGAEGFAATWLKGHLKDGPFRLYLAEAATARKDFRAAVLQYRVLLESQPNNAAVLNNLAWSAGQLKDPKAIEYAEKANKLAPDQASIMDTLGVLLVEKGDTARGVELLQKAATLAPQAATIHLNLARALIKAGQKVAAQKELDELAKLGDKFPGQAEVVELRKAL